LVLLLAETASKFRIFHHHLTAYRTVYRITGGFLKASSSYLFISPKGGPAFLSFFTTIRDILQFLHYDIKIGRLDDAFSG
jgi:hypothetical protein